MKLFIVVGALMAVEGVGVFFAAKMFAGAPQMAAADEGHADEPDAAHGDTTMSGESGHDSPGDHGGSGGDGHGAKADAHGSKGTGHDAKPDAHAGEKADAHGTKPDGKGKEPSGTMMKPVDSMSEIELADCRLHNSRSGRMILVRIRVSALVAAADHVRAKSLVEAKKSRIQDRISSVIRSSEPKYLNEPGLETLKRILKHEFGQLMGDNQIIREVLVPELLQT
jgi:hypothetical protein